MSETLFLLHLSESINVPAGCLCHGCYVQMTASHMTTETSVIFIEFLLNKAYISKAHIVLSFHPMTTVTELQERSNLL